MPNGILVSGKGEKFAVTPNMMPVKDITSNVEVGIHNLLQVVVQKIRHKAARVLLRTTLLKCNLLAVKLSALKDLREDGFIIVQLRRVQLLSWTSRTTGKDLRTAEPGDE